MFTSRGILVHYKVYLKNGDGSNIEIRRFDSQDVHYLGFNSLCSKLKNIFPELGDKNYTTSWIDEDNDEIKITCDEELSTALDIAVKEYSRYKETLLLDRPIIKLYVKLNQKNKNAQFFQKEEIIHDNVICDSCDNAISGFRYKCMICENYDLCSQCEMLGLHAEHYMLRMLQPLNWSTHSGKRLLDHIKKFFKRKIRSYYYNRESSDHETRKEKQSEENVAATSENIVEEFPKRNTKLIDQTVVELQLASDNAFVSHNNTTSEVNPLMEEWTILDKNDISRTSSVSFNLNESSENNLATVPTSTTATTSAAMSVETKTASVATLMATPVATSTYTSATTSATTPGATAVCTSVITPVTTSVSTSATTSVTAPMRSSPQPIYPQLPKESRIHHPNSRIHNALLALITMGYSNNGGVLTHLLETENGDINKVIDILEYGKG